MKSRSIVTVLLLSLLFQPLVCLPCHAAVGSLLTIGAVRQMLLDAIGRLDTAIKNATENVKAAGNSLQANAMGVVSDIDARLGNKLGYTFDRLDSTERRLVEDAQALVGQIDVAASSLITQTASEARRVVGDADIFAYNALYSLPCRTQEPRVVYVTPDEVYETDGLQEITLRGNYLGYGKTLAVTIDSIPAKVLARTHNDLRLQVPSSVLADVSTPHSVSISIQPAGRYRKGILFGLLCWSSEKPVPAPIITSFVIQPKVVARLVANITPTVMRREAQDIPRHLGRTDNNCDANYAVDENWCVPDGWRLIATNPYSGPTETSANHNCGSGISSHQQSSDRCVLVRAQLRGCGYDEVHLLLTTVRNCRGSGWVHYDIVLHAERFVDTPFQAQSFEERVTLPVRTNALFTYTTDFAGQAPNQWHYTARVEFYRGTATEPSRSIQVSDTDATVAGVVSHIGNGQLALEFGQAFSTLPR